LLMALAAINKAAAQVHANDNLWYNNGAQVYVGSNCLVTIQGDVTNNQAGSIATPLLTNNGFMWVQGNMYGDSAFAQSGNGAIRLQNKTLLYTAPYASENYQVIQGGYAVHGNQNAIGTAADGSFYDLQLDNQNGLVFTKSNTDVRNSVDFKPASVTVDGITIAPNGITNRILTYDPGTAATPANAPANGANYTAIFGMMNKAGGLSNFKNVSNNLTANTTVLDSAYIQGKLRRAVDSVNGGSYGFPLGLEPSTSSSASKGIQYAKMDFTANKYNTVLGYFQQRSDNTDSTPDKVCSIVSNYVYYGASNHGQWIFTTQNSSNDAYNLTIYPQDYGITNSAKYFITQNNNTPVPGTQSCAVSPLGLSVNGITGLGTFDFAGGSTIMPEPDFTVTYPNTPTTGDVSTNDKIPNGATYGTPVPRPSNPSACAPTVASTGAYTFNCTTPGVYVFDVPVCEPAPSTICTSEPLTITVLNPNDPNPGPVANSGYSTVKQGDSVVIPINANNKCQNGPGCTLNNPTIQTPPAHGTYNTNTGAYTPDPTFVGKDSLQYTVCDNQTPAKCSSAWQYITVVPAGSPNSVTVTAGDIYVQTPYGTPANGNVNNNNPNGPYTIAPQTDTVPGKGSFKLASDGSYTFTPAPGFSGPVDFPYTICDTVAAPNKTCATATVHALVQPQQPVYNPDFAVTYPNTPTTGDVSTNDKIPNGATYGTPAPRPSNPSACAPTVTSTGAYTFNCSTPGVYVFDVPVCEPAPSMICTSEPLTITVLNPNDPNPGPVANPGYSTVKQGDSVVIPINANNKCQNGPGCTLNNPTVQTPPSHGTYNTNTGVYTPAPTFVGKDSLQYTVCDNQTPAKCASAWQYITVVPAGSPNITTVTASDIYVQTPYGIPANGNVNNNNPNGPYTIAPQTDTVPGKGSFTLASDGSYTFTPAPGFSGPVDFPYTICDTVAAPNKTCATATVHALVQPQQPVYNPDFAVTDKGVPLTGNTSTNDVTSPGTKYGNPAPNPANPTSCAPVVAANGSYTFSCDSAGTYLFNIPVCDSITGVCTTVPLTITNLDGSVNPTQAPIVNPDYATTIANNPVTISVTANDKCQNGPDCTLGTPSVVTAPQHGNFDPSTGIYTPANGFIGSDSLQYSVCDNQATPKCANAWVYITVLPSNAPNTTTAVDDYLQVPYDSTGTGNVKTNDSDPQGNTQTVNPQDTTLAGKGTLVLNADGSYTFTPANGFSGPVDFIYTTCDNGTPQACATATLHVLVMPPLPDLSPFIYFADDDNRLLSRNQTREIMVTIRNVGDGPTTDIFQFSIPKFIAQKDGLTTVVSANTSFTLFGTVVNFNNAELTVTDAGNSYLISSKPGVVLSPSQTMNIGFKITNVSASIGNKVISATVVSGSGGGETPFTNDTKSYYLYTQ